MRIQRLQTSGTVYTCNAWLVLGDWNRVEDVNALVDAGRDPAVIHDLLSARTGVGKRKLDRVVLTHSHFDHVEMLPRLRKMFEPQVCGLAGGCVPLDRVLQDGELIRLGDQLFEVIALPGHTVDSLGLLHPSSGVLFSGDAPVLIHSPGGTYDPGFVGALERLCQSDIGAIYPGHGEPVTESCNARLRTSLTNVRASIGSRPVDKEFFA